jgi:hypothetical protein
MILKLALHLCKIVRSRQQITYTEIALHLMVWVEREYTIVGPIYQPYNREQEHVFL